MSTPGQSGPAKRDELYARTIGRSGQLAAAKRRRQRLLVTLPAGLLLLALTGGVVAAVGLSGGPKHDSRVRRPHGAGSSTTTTAPGALVYRHFSPLSFTAVSLEQWWVLGEGAGCQGRPDCQEILQTTDGGQHFTKEPAPVQPASSTSRPGVRFANASDGYVYGPEIYATTDGGARWVRQSLPGPVIALEIGGDKAFALACPAQQCGLYSETVGTDGWTSIRLPTKGRPGYSQLSVSGSRIAVTEAVANGPKPVSFLLSTNGGASFVSRSTPCFPGLGGAVFVPASQTDALWAACPSGMEATPYVSTDSGISWHSASGWSSGSAPALCGQSSLGPCRPIFSNGLFVAPASGSEALALPAVSGAGLVLTTDGGSSYRLVYRGPSSDVLTWAGYSDTSRGYAILSGQSGGGLLETTDGGRAWRQVVFRS